MADSASESETKSDVAKPVEVEPEPKIEAEEERTDTESSSNPPAIEGDEATPPNTEVKSEEIKNEVKDEENETEEKMEVDNVETKDESEVQGRCYCNKERNLGSMELHCGYCMHVFHASCVQCYLGKCIPFMTNYQFFCKNCSPSEVESFIKKQASFSQMCQTTLANLTSSFPEKKFFSKDLDIIPYIEKNWEKLTTVPRRIKLTWHNTVAKTLMKDTEIFLSKEETPGNIESSLVNPDLSRICPNYEALFKYPGSNLFKGNQQGAPGADGKTRGTKRKAVDIGVPLAGKLKKSDQLATTKLSQFGYPMDHPFNKDGYRWILAETDPHAPNRDAFDSSIDMAGKAIPGYLYRKWLSNEVILAAHDRAPQLKLSEDRHSVTGCKGYSMVRATHGVRVGRWYYEVKITEMPPESASRIGWTQLLGNLQAPCGYDKFSYSVRSEKGTCFHQSRGKHYCSGYGEGDVLGFYLEIPVPENPGDMLPLSHKDEPLVKFKSHLYFEEKDHVRDAEKKLTPSVGSKITMYKNGKSQGVAFNDIFDGTYYPAISLYKNATVTVNFGPDFKCPPSELNNYRPMSEAVEDSFVRYGLSDLLYHIDHEDNLPEF